MIWILFVITLLVFFYVKVKRLQSFWERKGIDYIRPKFLLGSWEIIQSKSTFELVQELYEAFPGKRYHGAYAFLQPILVIKDPDLIKLITVKEFDHFVDHRTVVTSDIDPIWGLNLINSEGERWRSLRSTLSPSFTGSKMRIMFSLIEECAQQFVDHFRKNESEVIEVEAKDILSRYTNDVIATTAFGLKCDSLEDKNNDFYLMGKSVTNISGFQLLRYMIYMLSPTLMKILDIKVVPPHISRYFSRIIEDTVKTREERNIIRPDMIHLLMEARKGHHRLGGEHKSDESQMELTLEDITAQAFIFFSAGFETVSTLLNFTLYELALQPDIQERLRDEINSVSEKITYESLLALKYLDMVVSETLRKWLPSVLTDRKVTKPFTIQPERPDEKPLHLEKGVLCLLPISAIHRDPEYYPDPEKYDPERFSDENKHKIRPFTYIPFGAGPRNCIGNRFALMESKLLLFYVLKNFEIVPVKKTPIPIVMKKNQFSIVPEGGMWLGLKKIN